MATPPKPGGNVYSEYNTTAILKLEKARNQIRDLLKNVKEESDKRRAMREWEANDLLIISLSLSDISDAWEALKAQQEIIKEDRKLTNVIDADFNKRRAGGQ